MKKIILSVIFLGILSISVFWISTAEDVIELAYKAYNNSEDDKAIPLLKRAIRIQSGSLGPNHPKVAKSYYVLAMSYGHKKKYKLALDYHSKALAIRIKKLGKKHIDVALSYYQIAETYFGMKNAEQAIKYYYRSFAVKLLNPGRETPSIDFIFMSLRSFYMARGSYRLAGFFQTRAETSQRKIENIKWGLTKSLKNQTKENARLAVLYHRLAEAYTYKGQFDKAIANHKTGIRLVETHWSKNDDTLPFAYLYLSWAYLGKSDYKSAVKYAERAREIAKVMKRWRNSMMLLVTEYLSAIKQLD
ncbi:hypothetical protein MNBD_GAMMA12-1536 [hydrothermal vent metagenome]|uniref:Kinesin light chain n=1 Tax=hydrothermal vent metagenome TaxID=652676 RepID=A0A3B0ZAD0_9ZZZZ